MKFLKDFLTIFAILFCTILIIGCMIILLKAIFGNVATFISAIVLVFIVSMIYACVGYINRNY
jgi:amino acid permease